MLPTSSQKGLCRVGHERPLNTNSCASQPTDKRRVHKSCIEEIKRRLGVKTTTSACPHTAKVKHAKPKAHNGLLKAHWIAIECWRCVEVCKPSELKTGGPTPCSAKALQDTTATPDMNVGLSVADACDEAIRRNLKSWSASDRRTGGKAVPIREHGSDMASRRMSDLSAYIMLC